MSLRGRRVVLGVCGSIAAYKVVQVARDLTLAGAEVNVVMTESATRFVTPLTFHAITGREVVTDAWQGWMGHPEGHVALADRAELILVAPASAQTLARLALGLCDDMLGLTVLASDAPLVIAPAMHHRMWNHPATRAHVAALRERGATVIQPDTGLLASGAVGEGRLPEPPEILGAVRWRLGRRGRLAGKRVVVTAGGTREPLDPVRYLGNRSSGRMGYALAQAATDEGGDVTIVSANVSLPEPWGAEVRRVGTAEEMLRATREACERADVLIMAAAVADYRPESPSDAKIKKSGEGLSIRLVETEDVVASIDRPGLIKVGFAAETHDLETNARAKMAKKRLSLIVANDAAATIGAEDACVALLYPDGRREEHGPLPKAEIAERIVEAVCRLAGQS